MNSSRSKNQTVILSETELDTATLMNAIRSTGYEVGRSRRSRTKKKDYLDEFLDGQRSERGVNVNRQYSRLDMD